MAYTKTDFTSGVGPAFDAPEANKIGTGIEDAHKLVEDATVGHTHDGIDSLQISYLDLADKPKDRGQVVLAKEGNLAVGTGVLAFDVEFSETVDEIVEVRARLKGAPTGADLIIDITVGEPGAEISIWDNGVNRLTVFADNKTANTGTVNLPGPHAKGTRVQLDIDQVGSTFAGSTLMVWIVYETALVEPAA